MENAPERIRVAQDTDGFWTCREAVSGSQEYVRADLHASLAAEVERLRKDRESQIAYSCDLQRIIEALCDDRSLPEPETSARHHYDMAAAKLADYAALKAENERLTKELSATRAERERAQIACQQIAARAEASAAVKELSGFTGELREKVAEAIRADGSDLDDTPWEALSEERKIGWLGDADRALAVVKEYLTDQSAGRNALDKEWDG